MERTSERRQNERVRFLWPVFFGFDNNGAFHRGQIKDLSTQAVCFNVDQSCDNTPSQGEWILTRFSYPLRGASNFQMGSYLHWSQVIRVNTTSSGNKEITIKFDNPIELDYKPKPVKKKRPITATQIKNTA